MCTSKPKITKQVIPETVKTIAADQASAVSSNTDEARAAASATNITKGALVGTTAGDKKSLLGE